MYAEKRTEKDNLLIANGHSYTLANNTTGVLSDNDISKKDSPQAMANQSVTAQRVAQLQQMANQFQAAEKTNSIQLKEEKAKKAQSHVAENIHNTDPVQAVFIRVGQTLEHIADNIFFQWNPMGWYKEGGQHEGQDIWTQTPPAEMLAQHGNAGQHPPVSNMFQQHAGGQPHMGHQQQGIPQFGQFASPPNMFQQHAGAMHFFPSQYEQQQEPFFGGMHAAAAAVQMPPSTTQIERDFRPGDLNVGNNYEMWSSSNFPPPNIKFSATISGHTIEVHVKWKPGKDPRVDQPYAMSFKYYGQSMENPTQGSHPSLWRAITEHAHQVVASSPNEYLRSLNK